MNNNYIFRTANRDFENSIDVAMTTLSSSGEHRLVSEVFGVGKSTVWTILIEFCEEVCQELSIRCMNKLPPTQELLK